MKLHILVAAFAVLLVLAVATASASVDRATKAQANTLTVWLQVDAQSGWPDLVAAANQAFQAAHPGWTVNVQYQNWGDHLQKFDATLAGGNTPDVIEMGNTEMVKYMAANAFADISSFKGSFDNSSNWLAGLAKSGMYGGKTYGAPYYVVTYRTDPGRSQTGPGVLDVPADRQLVVVLRDAARHAWQRELAAEAAERRPDTVFVEVGLPGAAPPGGAGYLVTYGAGRANLEAAAAALTRSA